MTCILRLGPTETDDVASAADVVFAAKIYPWTARIIADVPIFVKVGVTPEATDEDIYLNEFESPLFNIAAGEAISVLGSDTGKVWVTEVYLSS